MTSFLDLWNSSELADSGRIGHMYGRLTKNTANRWGFNEFKNYIINHPLEKWRFVDGFHKSSVGGEGTQYTFSALVTFREGEFLNRFILRETPALTLAIDLTLPLTTPRSFDERVRVTNFSRYQSGSESGYRDVVFTTTVVNTSQDLLKEVSVYVYWMDISEANLEIGTLPPGERREVAIVWKDAFMPIGRNFPPKANQLVGDLTIRILYKFATAEGNWWSESTNIPPGDIKDIPDTLSVPS